MKIIDVDNWNRKQLYEHFLRLEDPSFSIVVPMDVTNCYHSAKSQNQSFFAKYLHDCLKAINEIENFRYRIVDDVLVEFNKIHASATILRENKTFGFSFIHFDKDFNVFLQNFEKEKNRIQNSMELYPPVNGQDCIHCSALPWTNFISHKEPRSGELDTIPKIAFSKIEKNNGRLNMNVAVNVNHALIDGYHVSEFVNEFQSNLNK